MSAHVDPTDTTTPDAPLSALAMDHVVLDQYRHGTTDGRYTLQCELARGGMGRVWIADDVRLSRRVAIKELIEPTVTQLARFERELSLTSRLEHPGIVSIHDGGTWPDGKPFYVMRLVTGESLDRALARATNLAERMALLPHGLAAVDAIAYAHSQGIVHRDLKPANVLVGEYGETVVIDWGLAKDLRAVTPELHDGPYRGGTAVGETAGGEVIGTPAYMPPEQALGDAVDERADVYALGSMLYHLLSGVAPHQGASVNSVLASVISEPPPPIATRAPGVPADLAAIIDKAMAPKLEDRYVTAAELSADLKRFHGGQLVGAHRYTGRQLVRRWLRKHRASVIVASAAAIALATLGGVSFARIVGEQREAEQARHAAELQRGKAEDNHAKAEKLVNFMLVELGDKLKPIGKLDLLESVASQASDYYRDQPDAPTADEQHRRAVALHRVGDVLTEKNQAAAALAEHQAGLAIHQQLAASDPKREPDLALSYMAVGEALRRRGEQESALAAYQSALAINEKLVAASPDDERAIQQLAQVSSMVGDLHHETRRDQAAALREQRRALELRERLVALKPSDRRRTRDVINTHADIARILNALGDTTNSLTEHRETLRLAETFLAADPEDALALRLLMQQHNSMATVLLNRSDPAQALVHTLKSLEINERLIVKDPASPQLKTASAQLHMNIAFAEKELGHLEAAQKHYRVALEIVEKQLRNDNSNIVLRGLYPALQGQLGTALLGQGHVDCDDRVRARPERHPGPGRPRADQQ
ncbi:MAG: serine/threonine-protein kinase [Kofleriaceae bacterium]